MHKNDVCHFIFISCKIFSNNFYVFSVQVIIVKEGEFPDIHGSSRYDFVSDTWFVLILIREHVLFFQIFKMCYLTQHVVHLGKVLLSQLNRTWFCCGWRWWSSNVKQIKLLLLFFKSSVCLQIIGHYVLLMRGFELSNNNSGFVNFSFQLSLTFLHTFWNSIIQCLFI